MHRAAEAKHLGHTQPIRTALRAGERNRFQLKSGRLLGGGGLCWAGSLSKVLAFSLRGLGILDVRVESMQSALGQMGLGAHTRESALCGALGSHRRSKGNARCPCAAEDEWQRRETSSRGNFHSAPLGGKPGVRDFPEVS